LPINYSDDIKHFPKGARLVERGPVVVRRMFS